MTNSVARWPSVEMSANAQTLFQRYIKAALIKAPPTRITTNPGSFTLFIKPARSSIIPMRMAIKVWWSHTYDLYRASNFNPTNEISMSFVHDNKIYVGVYPYTDMEDEHGFFKFKFNAIHDI